MREIVLALDNLDWEAVQHAIAVRQRLPMPNGDSNTAGTVIAEICRGWLEERGEWPPPLMDVEDDDEEDDRFPSPDYWQ